MTDFEMARCDNPNCRKCCYIGVIREYEGMRLCPKCWPKRARISKLDSRERRGSPR